MNQQTGNNDAEFENCINLTSVESANSTSNSKYDGDNKLLCITSDATANKY